MVLSAHSMGLAPAGWALPSWPSTISPKWKKFFGISYPFKFITSMAVGWPMGEPDGMVERQTHGVDWYENGKKDRGIYEEGGSMG